MSIRQMKSLLRKELKKRLTELTDQEKAVQSAIIKQKVLLSEIYKNSNRISIFLPMKEEVNALPILKAMLDAGKQCFIPHFEGPNMIMVSLDSWEAYEKLPINSMGIKQPPEFRMSDDAFYTGGLDLIFMPGLAFTREGARLGRGKGYYDQYLHKYKESGKMPQTVALIFKEQVVDYIPTSEQDMFVDSLFFASNKEIDEFSSKSCS